MGRSWLLLPLSDWLFCVGLLREELAQPIQAALPQRHSFVDPLFGEPESIRRDAAGAHTPDLLGVDHATFLEDLKVLDDRRERDRERLRQRADRDRTATQPLQDGPSVRIAECVKDSVDLLFVKHRLEYRPCFTECQATT